MMETASEARPDTKEGGGRGGHQRHIAAGGGAQKDLESAEASEKQNGKKYKGRNKSCRVWGPPEGIRRAFYKYIRGKRSFRAVWPINK